MRELKGVVPNETAISCSSEELAKQVHIILKECGYVWNGGGALVETLHYSCGVVLYHIYDEGHKFIAFSTYSTTDKTVLTAEEFIKINSNMEKLTKEQVYVSITSDEEAVKLRQAYREADNKQKAILIEVAPLPKVKSTVKVSRWVNVYDETNSVYKPSNGVSDIISMTKEDAIQYNVKTGYIDAIELTGEYTTEVEDPLMDLDGILF